MDLVSIILIAFLPILLMASAFFSGTETALFSLTRHQRAQLSNSTSIAGQTLTQLLTESRALLISLLLGNMTINVLYFVVSGALLRNLSELGMPQWWIATLSPAPLLCIIFLGEVLPKLIASKQALTWAKWVAVPIMFVHRTVAPIRNLALIGIITPIARLVAPATQSRELEPQELEVLLKLSAHQGRAIDASEEFLLQQVLELSQIKARDLMTPRVDITCFDLKESAATLVSLAQNSARTILPVYQNGVDNILGIVASRQVLMHHPTTTQDIQKLIQHVPFVPEQQRGDRLLVELRKQKSPMAIVVDEYGGTAGLVTLSDMVEHMFGDLPSEDDDPSQSPMIQALADGQWLVRADLPVHEWTDFLGHATQNAWSMSAKAKIKSVTSIGGLVMSELGRLPQTGDEVHILNLKIAVESMQGPRLRTLRISLSSKQSAATTTTNNNISNNPNVNPIDTNDEISRISPPSHQAGDT